MSFIWRTNAQSTQAPPDLSNNGLLIVRISISSVLGLGLSYGVLVLTTFSRYGETMERAWKRKINEWVQEKILLHGHASYGAQSYEPHPAPSGQYPHLPELYSQSLPHRASNASGIVPPFSVAQSSTHHGKKPALSLSEKADPRKRFNPPAYLPSSPGRWDASRFKDQSRTPKRGQVAAGSSIHQTDFHVPSLPRIPPVAKLDAPFTDISANNAPASDDDGAESKHYLHSSGSHGPVDEDGDETSVNRVRLGRWPRLSATSSDFQRGDWVPDTSRPVSPAIPSDWVPRSFPLQELRSENDSLSAPLTGEQNAASPSQNSLRNDALETNVKQAPPGISLSAET